MTSEREENHPGIMEIRSESPLSPLLCDLTITAMVDEVCQQAIHPHMITSSDNANVAAASNGCQNSRSTI
jgi:hypothetical protein